MYRYKARVVRVIDGDTADLDVELGFFITTRIRARFKGVDTPERGEEDFDTATETCRNLLDAACDSEGYIIIETEKTGKFGRWIVFIEGVTDILAKAWPY